MNKTILLIFVLSIISCTKQNNVKNNEVNSSKNYSKDQIEQNKQTSMNWWENFNDPDLNNLIKQALEYNSDVEIAFSNIEKARANLALSKSSIFPSIEGEISEKRAINSKQVLPTITIKPYDLFTAGFNVNYQVDLWNKLSNARKAARAKLLAAESSKDNAKLTISSDLAKTYFKFISLNKQKKLISEMISTQKEIYRLNQLKYEVGSIDQSTFLSIEKELNILEASLTEIDQNITTVANSIKILIGKKFQELSEELNIKNDIDNIQNVLIIPKTLPAQLIIQRPDIQASEENLKAANLDVSIARLYYLPDLSLNGLLGLASSKIENIFDNSNNWMYGASIKLPLFNYNKNKADVKLKEAIAKESLAEYNKNIKIAFTEILDALSAQKNSQINYDKVKNNEDIMIKLQKIAQTKYSVGYVSYIDVLMSKKSLINAQIETLKAKQNQLNSAIYLFKSLGGNW